jgi:hypothetical protein
MGLLIVWISCCTLAPPLYSQTALTPETLLLARIKVRAEENLQRLPNYTCLETVERSTRRPSGKFQLVDVLRMEVAFVDRKELFAWPGSQQFEDRDLSEMIGYGAIGNGSFALHARSVFLGSGATFTHVGERIRDGRRTIRYDYRVPRIQSGYRLRVKPAEGIVGFRGSFWVDAESLDLIRLEVIADDIPAHVPILSSSEILNYAAVRIADHEFLLPSSSELVLTDLRSNENRNRVSFTQCRQFAGDSVLSFDEAPSSTEVKRRAKTEVRFDSDLEIELKLESTIEAGVSAVGDAISAVTVRNVTKKGIVVIPKGAAATGRIVKLQRRSSNGDVFWIVGIQFMRAEWEEHYADLHLRLMASQPLAQYPQAGWQGRSMIIAREDNDVDSRIGILYIRGDKGRIPAGFRTHWRTQTHNSEDHRDSVRAGK